MRRRSGEDTNYYGTCCQNCNEKGQISSIKLYPAGENSAAWTLIYTHRPFSPDKPFRTYSPRCPGEVTDATLWPLWYSHALHSIHVYQGDRTEPNTPTLPPTVFYGAPIEDPNGLPVYYEPNSVGVGAPIHSFDEYDAIEVATFRSGFQSDWDICVKYMYEEPDHDWYEHSPEDTQYKEAWSTYVVGIVAHQHPQGADANTLNLLKATVARRTDPDDPNDVNRTTTSTVYRYDAQAQGYEAMDYGRSNGGTGLRAVYSDATLRSLLDPNDPNTLLNSNELFALRDDCVDVRDPVTGEVKSKHLWGVADVFLRSCIKDRESHPDRNQALSGVYQEAWDEFNLPQHKAPDVRGRVALLDRRDGNRTYRIMKFRIEDLDDPNDPNFVCLEPGSEPDVADMVTLHYPYRWYEAGDSPWEAGVFRLGSDPRESTAETWQSPFYVTIVDEVETDPNELEVDIEPDPDARVLSRRVVEMNIAGIVLRERVKTYDEDGTGTLVSSVGTGSAYFYDTKGRVVAVASEGWNAAQADGQGAEATSGLVQRFIYGDELDPNYPDEVMAVGIQEGFDPDNFEPNSPLGNGTIYLLEHYERGYAQRTDLVSATVTYPDPVQFTGSLPQSGGVRKETIYSFSGDDDAVSEKIVKGAGARITRESSTLFYPVEKTLYDNTGREEYSGVGCVAEPNNPGGDSNHDVFFVTYREYYDQPSDPGYGQLEFVEVDTNQHSTTGYVRSVPNATANPPLNLTTTYDYHPTYGVNYVQFPNGREQFIKYTWPNGFKQWIFNDVVQDPNDPNVCDIRSPVTVNEFDGGNADSDSRNPDAAFAVSAGRRVHVSRGRHSFHHRAPAGRERQSCGHGDDRRRCDHLSQHCLSRLRSGQSATRSRRYHYTLRL